MEKITLAVIATVIFGKLIPVILLTVLVVGLALIMREAANRDH